jgi:hypothetical protein
MRGAAPAGEEEELEPALSLLVSPFLKEQRPALSTPSGAAALLDLVAPGSVADFDFSAAVGAARASVEVGGEAAGDAEAWASDAPRGAGNVKSRLRAKYERDSAEETASKEVDQAVSEAQMGGELRPIEEEDAESSLEQSREEEGRTVEPTAAPGEDAASNAEDDQGDVARKKQERREAEEARRFARAEREWAGVSEQVLSWAPSPPP